MPLLQEWHASVQNRVAGTDAATGCRATGTDAPDVLLVHLDAVQLIEGLVRGVSLQLPGGLAPRGVHLRAGPRCACCTVRTARHDLHLRRTTAAAQGFDPFPVRMCRVLAADRS